MYAPKKKGHAIVLGAGIAGLHAASVLARHFARVTLVERRASTDDATLLEHERAVRALPGVTFLASHEVLDAHFYASDARVRGVQVRNGETQRVGAIEGDLVVDATGAASAASSWLATWGFGRVAESVDASGGVRRHFERLDRVPGGFLVLGDALASGGGGGASVVRALLQAQALDECLEDRRERLAERFWASAARLRDGAANQTSAATTAPHSIARVLRGVWSGPDYFMSFALKKFARKRLPNMSNASWPIAS